MLDEDAALALKSIAPDPLCRSSRTHSTRFAPGRHGRGSGVKGLRINPGNIGGPDKVDRVVDAARAAGVPSHRREQRLGR